MNGELVLIVVALIAAVLVLGLVIVMSFNIGRLIGRHEHQLAEKDGREVDAPATVPGKLVKLGGRR